MPFVEYLLLTHSMKFLISPGCLLEGLMLKLKLPILWPPDAKSWLIWKDPDAGKDWEQEEKGTTGWDGWMASPTQWTWVCVNSGSWWWTGRPGVLRYIGSTDMTEQLNWTELIYFNWRIIALQYCDGFYHTSAWICHRYACVPLYWLTFNFI